MRRADGDQDGTLRRVPRLHAVSQVQVHAARSARHQVSQVRRWRSRRAAYEEGTDVLRLPAVSGLRLFHLEQAGGGGVPELRLRGHGRAEVQDDGRDDTQVSQVRARNAGGRRSTGGGGGDVVVHVVGGGLAGCEAAWALAERGVSVTLHEMRPVRMTPAHQTDGLAELVCSNTFKSTDPLPAHGLLKAEMRLLRRGGGSIVLQAADEARIPGGSALAGDRVVFSARVQERVLGHPNIKLVRGEV